MTSAAIPASVIVRSAEAAVQRAASLREAARLYLEEADTIEAAARASAVEVLGEELGEAALRMAALTVAALPVAPQAAPAVLEQTQSPAAVVSAFTPPVAVSHPVPAPSAAAAPSEEVVQPKTSEAPAKIELYGIDVPPSRMQEAAEITAQASAMFSQGRKTNPYASDRGKNAWRKALYKAAWDSLASEAGDLSKPLAPASSVADKVQESQAPQTSSSINTAPSGGPLDGDLADLDEEELEDRAETVDDLEAEGDQPDLEELDDGEVLPDFSSSANAGIDDDFSFEGDDVTADDFDDEPAEHLFEPEFADAIQVAEGEPGLNEDIVHPETGAVAEPEPAVEANHSEGETELAESLSDGALVEAASPSAGQVEHDPFDDLAELPPASTLPPPRGYPVASRPVPTPLAKAAQADEKSAAPSGVAVPAALAETGPKTSAAPVRPPVPAAARPAPSKPAGPPMHTPVPIPSSRRPGNGQVLQRPAPIPASAQPTPSVSQESQSVLPRTTAAPKRPAFPSFASR